VQVTLSSCDRLILTGQTGRSKYAARDGVTIFCLCRRRWERQSCDICRRVVLHPVRRRCSLQSEYLRNVCSRIPTTVRICSWTSGDETFSIVHRTHHCGTGTRLSLRHPPSIRVCGKGRRERCLPLWKETAADLRAWLAVRGPVRTSEIFVNAAGAAMTRAGFEYIPQKHVQIATEKLPDLKGRSVSPHQLRHSCAVIMLQATRDVRKVALCLG